jgi:hypothetical protein
MFLHLTKHIAVQLARGTTFSSWLHKIHVFIGQQWRSSDFTRLLKKNLNYYQGQSVLNDKNKMTEVKVNYTILLIKFCKGTYSYQAFPR